MMERQEWLEARRKGIGGSDIAAICGLSRWKSPMAVYLDKIGASDEAEPNEAMYWGTKLESVVMERFAEDHPELVVWDAEGIQRHPDHEWALGSYDGLCWPNGGSGFASASDGIVAGWEGKTASSYKRSEWEGTEPPVEYTAQCQWYMAVSGLERWFLSVLIGGQQYLEFVVERDDEFIDMLLERAEAFWKLVEDKTPPEIDGSDASSAVLDTLYPAGDAILDPPLMLDAERDLEAQAYLEAKSRLAAAEADVKLYENQLKESLGTNAVAVVPSGIEITWKPRERNGIDAKRLKEEQPKIAAKYATHSEFRVFSVKPPKEESE